ncbi:MAG: DUF2304 domain-containing protein [Lachnospiraceae bacterium]|nr:DUF2304 domain-containing protein [Lachnospiraceae bacterium]
MELRLQIFIGIMVVAMLLAIANMVRKGKIDLRYALGWMGFAVFLLVLDIFPEIVFWFAELIGISIPANMLFLIGVILAIVMIYSLTVSVSNLSMKVKRLTQELALLRAELEKNVAKNDTESDSRDGRSD